MRTKPLSRWQPMLLLLLFMMVSSFVQGQNKKIQDSFNLPDSVKATAFYTEISLQPDFQTHKKGFAGIGNETVGLRLEQQKKGLALVMTLPKGAQLLTSGMQTARTSKAVTFETASAAEGIYKLLLVKAFDSAQNFTIWSGYAFLPTLQKWKLLATVRVSGAGYINTMHRFHSSGKKDRILEAFSNTAFQRSNGTWRSPEGTAVKVPAINWLAEADSSARAMAEKNFIEKAGLDKRGLSLQYKDGIYYAIREQGTGAPLKVTDELSVYYKGYLLSDSTVFDQTAPGKPARFPLSRLIKGWQIGVPLINEGGKITLVIPSGLAYSIRTRSPKIPPNSVLVFEIEVVKREGEMK